MWRQSPCKSGIQKYSGPHGDQFRKVNGPWAACEITHRHTHINIHGHTRMHAHTHTRTHTHKPTHTHTHSALVLLVLSVKEGGPHTQNVNLRISVNFPSEAEPDWSARLDLPCLLAQPGTPKICTLATTSQGPLPIEEEAPGRFKRMLP